MQYLSGFQKTPGQIKDPIRSDQKAWLGQAALTPFAARYARPAGPIRPPGGAPKFCKREQNLSHHAGVIGREQVQLFPGAPEIAHLTATLSDNRSTVKGRCYKRWRFSKNLLPFNC